MPSRAQLGCDYSPQLIELLRSGAVRVDWIKLSRRETFVEELDLVRPYRPVLLHTLPPTEAGLPDSKALLETALAVEACGSPHVAVHFAFHQREGQPQCGANELVQVATQVVRAWHKALRIPILIENLTYYGEGYGYLRDVSSPYVIRELCDLSGAGLLLDLAHARVAASHRGDDIHSYLAAMPLGSVREIHVNAPALDQSGLRDAHYEMQQEDFCLLEWIMAQVQSTIVTLEYGGTGPRYAWRSDKAALLRQLRRLQEIVEGHGQARGNSWRVSP